jgi:carboxyl-terminal processing protease
MSKRSLRWFFPASLVAILAWQSSGDAKPKDEMLELYGLFVDAVEKVEANYVRPVSRKELLESALEGMLQNLDPHSTYINNDEWKQFRKQIEGRFGGIGIQVGVDSETRRLRVIAPMVGTPAYEAGILAGDQIMEIDGRSAEGMTPDRAVEVLTGRPGTEVKLSVIHEGDEEPTPVTIVRAIIDVPSVLGDKRKPDDQFEFMIDKDRKIGYLRITSFVQKTPDEVKSALDQLKDEGVKGVIIDLRDDPGGLLSSAVEVAELFLSSGEIVSTRGRNTPSRRYDAHQDSPYEDLPLVVLINQNSASASEILAAALQDHKRAAIVGQRSYGKGSVQSLIDLDNGNSILKLTIASYYRPSGENIHRFKNAKLTDKWGVTPDPGLEVKLSPKEYLAWFVGRRNRELESGPKGHRLTAPKAEKVKEKAAPGPEKEKAIASRPETQPGKPAAGKPSGKTAEAHGQPAAPFVDKQLDKALEVMRARLEAKPKSA